ncbi:nitrite reductase large subunit [Pseudonocardiaceae bacterium YIM PH 21723]|nr:nitrite reductase large subunit [Pseudonocardiaceae bacterium YIM PH 21723]
MVKTLIVAGNGMVGHHLVRTLRARDTEGAWRVIVCAEESRPAYDRVALSSYATHWDPTQLYLESVDDQVELRLGEPVLTVDRAARVVQTAGGTLSYDALVLATGSYPFVPPVPGRDLDGCFTYRTIEDLDAIRSRAASAGSGVVIGGGLLGLEAAGLLRDLGLKVDIVEFAPRLMPLQVDEAGGALLRRLIEDMGVKVHTDAAAQFIECGSEVDDVRGRFSPEHRQLRDSNPVEGLTLSLSSGTLLDTDLIVFSAGVRPRDELADQAGLVKGERGGFLVDEHCRTHDEHIWAIGECAAVDGRCYGLVAPGYSMAEAVAEQLLGSPQAFPGADLSTKLKLMGVGVASFGETTGPLDVVYNDPATGNYAKLVLSDDAQTLLGGMLVGDTDAYGILKASVGSPLPAAPLALLAPAGTSSAEVELPGSAQVCSCHAVSKHALCTAIHEQELTDVPGIKACTKAGTGCGGCVPMLNQLLKKELAKQGKTVSKALCEHFTQSRQELFDIVRVAGIGTFSQLIAEHGTGRGCDICKPAVASILASLGGGHILGTDQVALQDTNDRYLANIQRDGTYSVVPRIPGGEITPDKLIVIGEVARDFGLYTKITGGQRIDMFGARVEQLPLIWKRLVDAGFESGHAYGKSLRTVKSCVGSTWCRYGVQDSVGMAVELELRYRGLRSPHKLKSAVSGCARECAEARSKDFGIIATDQGWNLYVGGNGGTTPRHADLLVSDVDSETLIRTIDRFLMFYIRTADRLQRTATWLESLDGGLDYLRGVIIDDSLGICAELDAAMATHVESYADEWAGVLQDKEKLARFSSFVNAPAQPDPSISFREERGQKVPVLLGLPGRNQP